ncbi:MAG: polysaccharide deacetylase family protein [Prosthecobacter sp.]|jgi:peptidoglycan/xylan/chitin deacetylase (PgdA/CDA1 family)|nr:polysaccharide deacetylase family protein [Prosthecobacter sp.]
MLCRPVLCLSLLLLPPILGSCKRLESKLDRLARLAGLTVEEAPKQRPTAPPEAPLSPEQQALEARVLNSAVFEVSAPPPPTEAPAFELNKSSVVSILGYHDFRERGGSPMIISASKFQEQMRAVKESGIPVIPLSDVLEWRKGKKNIPEEAIVITMDDGWEGVYTHAFPILKQYGFPFTVYLYKKYVNIGGRSLSWAQVKEMMKHGCEIGSHSVSHESLRQTKARTASEQQLWLLSELKDSKEFLEINLGVPCTSFAYPFGIFDDGIMELGAQVGYETLVTVNSQKVTWETPLGKLGRYIIHGENDTNFKLATSFRGRGDVSSNRFLAAKAKDAGGNALITLSPAPDEVVPERQPIITVGLARMAPIIPESVKMRVAGLGIVPAQFDPATQQVTYRLPFRLRRDDCAVTLSFKRAADQPDEVITWRFKVDLAAAYQPGKLP